MAKQVLDIHPGIGMTTSQSNEHLRVASNGAYISRLSNNFDPTREHLNFEIKSGGIISPVDKAVSIPRRIKNILNSREITDPNQKSMEKGGKPNRRTVANIILGGSRDQMHRLAYGDQHVILEHGADNASIKRMPEIENWAIDMYKFMSDKFGEKNIAAFVVHLDETNPHIHCTLLPITERNKFSWNHYFGGFKQDGREKFIKLHNAISQINAKYGLERGDNIAETGAKHRTTEQYHQNLRKQLEEETRKQYQEMNKNEKTIEEQKKTISGLEKDIKHATARVKGLNTMIRHLETYKNDLEQEIEQLNQDRNAGKVSAEEAAKKIEAINKKLEEVREKITDKEDKLHKAEQQLEKLQEDTKSTEQHYQTVQKKLDTDVPELNRKVLHEMQALGYNIAALDAKERFANFNRFKENLPYEERQKLDKAGSLLLDGSMFEQMAENAASVTTVATALFLGYLDKATEIAESHGGGGSPGTGWGKRDDEDDLAFRRRCFFTAMHMMRPTPKVKQKR